MIETKSKAEIAIMHESGRRLSSVMKVLSEAVCPGISTLELDRIAESEIRKLGGVPSFKGLYGFPATICASINDVIVHGIPNKKMKLKEGDIIGIDIGLCYNGYHSDMARTFAVGNISEEDQRLIDVTRESFWNGLKYATLGNRIGDIGHEIQRTAESAGFSVVREMIGHGIGREVHMEPEVPNYGKKGHGPRLIDGMVIAIEPMINAGVKEGITLEDGWTYVTADGAKSAHYENTVAITADGPIPLTEFEVERYAGLSD